MFLYHTSRVENGQLDLSKIHLFDSNPEVLISGDHLRTRLALFICVITGHRRDGEVKGDRGWECDEIVCDDVMLIV